MKYFSHLNSAMGILNYYDGKEPFYLFIKKYFAGNKKFGSKDRKQIFSFCYNYFRLGKAVLNISKEERILLGSFLCENKKLEILKELKPEWYELADEPLDKKLEAVNLQLKIKDIFPFADELSEGIDADNFRKSFLIQPDLYLRVRPGNFKKVAGKLSGAGFTYQLLSENCLSLPNASKVDAVIELDKEAVVQDYNSQRVGEFLQLQTTNHKLPTNIWDCCAASGGKSIMAYDIMPNINLTVSDKRESILQNLYKRFAVAGIKNYKYFVADLENEIPNVSFEKYDLIICDAPCTGSGTWARTTEQLCYFKKETIGKYSNLQKKILKNVVRYLKPGGQLLYITCSVFKKENEDTVKHIEDNLHLTLQKSELLKGYEMKGDSMFAALFTLPIT